MLLYAGTYCESGAWRAPKRGCFQLASSPQLGMYVSLSLVTSFSFQVVYMSLIHYFIWSWHICYFICRPLVRHRCVKSTKPVTHRSRASRYVYVDRFLCTFVYISWSSNIQYVYPWFGHVTCFMQVADDEYIVSQSIPSHAEVDSQTQVLFEIFF